MKSKLLAVLAVVLLAGPMAANAIPIRYDVRFDANLGPDGAGNLFWDADAGAITDFFWEFVGGYSGGVGDFFGTAELFGGTYGQFAFAILSEQNVHPGIDCVVGDCLTGVFVEIGVGPLNANGLQLRSIASPGGGAYIFYSSFVEGPVAEGLVSVRPSASVSEPGTISLLAFGLAGLGLIRRRKLN